MNFLSDLLPTEKDRQDFFISLFVIAFFGGILYVFFPVAGNQIDKNPHATTNLANTIPASEINDTNHHTENIDENWEEDAYRYPDEETYIEEAIIPAATKADSLSTQVSDNITKEELDVIEEEEEDENQEDLIESVIDSLEEGKTQVTTELQTTESESFEEEKKEKEPLLEEEKEILEEVTSTTEVVKKEVDNKISNSEKTPATPSETSKKLIEETKESNDAENSGQSFDCAIVIGAFLDKGNIESLKKRLKKDGYNIYLSWRKGYRVIGVETPCEKAAAKKTLTTIRSKYAKDAWLLKKK